MELCSTKVAGMAIHGTSEDAAASFQGFGTAGQLPVTLLQRVAHVYDTDDGDGDPMVQEYTVGSIHVHVGVRDTVVHVAASFHAHELLVQVLMHRTLANVYADDTANEHVCASHHQAMEFPILLRQPAKARW
ncbi:hypothetical protein Droror1_Dr00000950 [Drosera rotundifolia]